MTNKLVEAMGGKKTPQRKPRTTLTENGALAIASNGGLLDFFSKSGALRNRENEFIKMFDAAFMESPLYAVRALFHARDIRGGNGERANFRAALNHTYHVNKFLYKKILRYVPEFGRWDDIIDFPTPEVEELVSKQFYQDLRALDRGDAISLLGKWMPSENASSKNSAHLARHYMRVLNLTPREYRKALTSLRDRINIVETMMSQGEWSGINYEHVPSQASKLYRKAFSRHDGERYTGFIKAAKAGKKKINTGTLTPYQLVAKAMYGEDDTIEAMWRQLPNYVEKGSLLVVADTSQSMERNAALPLATAVALALYAADKNKGPFKGCWINFSTRPTWQTVKGNTLTQKINNMDRRNWSQSTDIEAVFKMVLTTALENRVPQNDMPKIVAIVSDMQFNEGCGRKMFTNYEVIRSKYRQAGYEMPVLVFWNVLASHGQPVAKNDIGTILLSGESASAFKNLMECDIEKLMGATPASYMYDVLNSERYAQIEL